MANEKRLIDVDKAIKDVNALDIHFWHDGDDGVEMCVNLLRNAPTVDAVEVVHGKWEFGELEIMGQPVHCSICGWGSDMVNKAMWLEYPDHKYRGNCGAKMDGGNEDVDLR